MRSWGVWFIIFAVGSAILPYIGMQFILVAWIDMWGPTVGWIIRAAMAMAGVAMITFAPADAPKATEPQQAPVGSQPLGSTQPAPPTQPIR
ncbi:MAG: hypothetical protein ACREJO_19045 [Phycisphaerales bacterium]